MPLIDHSPKNKVEQMLTCSSFDSRIDDQTLCVTRSASRRTQVKPIYGRYARIQRQANFRQAMNAPQSSDSLQELPGRDVLHEHAIRPRAWAELAFRRLSTKMPHLVSGLTLFKDARSSVKPASMASNSAKIRSGWVLCSLSKPIRPLPSSRWIST